MLTLVRDVMTYPVQVVTPTTGFREVVRQIESRHISALPVISEDGSLVGIVSEADLLLKEVDPGENRRSFVPSELRRVRKSRATIASELMSSPVVTISLTASIPEAARVMVEKNVKRLPVVDDGARLVGMLTRSDLLRVFLRSDDELGREAADAIRALALVGARPSLEIRSGTVLLSGVFRARSDMELVEKSLRHIPGVVQVVIQAGYRVDDTSPDGRRWYETSLRPVGEVPAEPVCPRD